jgi:hypothetical protein
MGPVAIISIGLVGMVLGRALTASKARGRTTNAEEIKAAMIRAQQAQADAYRSLEQLRQISDATEQQSKERD